MLFKKKEKEKLRLKEEQRELGVSIGPLKASRKRVYEPSKEDGATEGPKSPEEEHLWKTTAREMVVGPGEYEPISLGHLGDGALVDFHVKEVYGLNVSVFIMDEDNLETYDRTLVTKGAIWRGLNLPEHVDTIQIARPAEYYIVITSRATEKNRKVWFKLEIKP